MTLKRGAQDLPVRFEEMNVLRLGLVSMQERIPADYSSWEETFEIDGQHGKVICKALPEYGVPHGVDNDVITALITLFREQGDPEDGRMVTSAYSLLQLAGMDVNGASYRLLRESLQRLWTTSYQITRLWRDHRRGRYTTVGLRIVHELEFTSSIEGDIDSDSALVLTLAPALVNSIRAGFVRPMDPRVARLLKRRSTRAFYRFLDAKRRDPTNPERITMDLQMSLMELKQACKIINDQPDKIRRSIEPAHEELLEIGYLKAVEYEGRGAKQQVIYRFSLLTTEEEPHVAFRTELEALGLKAPSLRTVLGSLDTAEVQRRLAKARQVLASYGTPPRNPAAVAADVLKNPEKYEAQAALLPLSHAPVRKGAGSSAVRETAVKEPPVLLPTGEDQMKTLRFLLKAHLSVTEIDALQAATRDGRLDAGTLIREASAARAALGMQAFIDDLRRQLA
ncbi:replication initiator protein A (plasmid) [Deinococcus sp. KNUC1210]|uniref:replication initiator protein A n=1 Tax=Deinococcus sp. KNUC1210 TaxID=2917691 RepID=UPI001EF02A83|nr:replication initiator protein A [Deinococcus sp. KNUC1210]ULH17481.1 replication initiator protein A [Deinococcus sp. KNUC1210]